MLGVLLVLGSQTEPVYELSVRINLLWFQHVSIQMKNSNHFRIVFLILFCYGDSLLYFLENCKEIRRLVFQTLDVLAIESWT
jgi:hypothetical protein